MTNGSNGHHSNGTSNGLVHVNSLPRAGHGGNGHKPNAAVVTEHELLWDGLPPAVTQALAQPLDSALVSQRKGRGGRTFDYLEGHVVIDQANRIFGFGGWGYELVSDVTLRTIETVDAQTGEVKVFNAYTAPVRVTVPGASPRTDIGFHAVTDETADGHETAIKGCVTDGMKRALRSFGDRFGNGLYGEQPPVVNAPRSERAPAQAHANRRNPARTQAGRNDAQVKTLRKQLMELAGKQGFDEAQVRAAVQRQMGKDLDDLTADEIGQLVEAAADKLREKQAQTA